LFLLPAVSRPSKVMSKALRAAFHRLLHRWPARVGRCGRAHSGALPCAGLPAVTVSSAVSPKLSQLRAAHRIPAPRRWLICALYAARSLAA
jgi:hypothetical protein